MTDEEAESIREARVVNEGDEGIVAQESVAANERDDDPEPETTMCEACGHVQLAHLDVCEACGTSMDLEDEDEDEDEDSDQDFLDDDEEEEYDDPDYEDE